MLVVGGTDSISNAKATSRRKQGRIWSWRWLSAVVVWPRRVVQTVSPARAPATGAHNASQDITLGGWGGGGGLPALPGDEDVHQLAVLAEQVREVPFLGLVTTRSTSMCTADRGSIVYRS